MKILLGVCIAILAIASLTQCNWTHDDSNAFRGEELSSKCTEVGKSGYRIFCQIVYLSSFFSGKNGLLPTARYFLVDDANMNTFLSANQLTEESFKNSVSKVNAFIDAHSAISDLTAPTLKLNSGRTVNISGTPENLAIDGLKATVTPIDGRLFKLQGILPVTLP